jgi:hypothetical protein
LAVRHSVEFMPGSLGWAIEKFLSSPLFNEKAENTKRGYRRILDQLRQSYGARDGHNDWNGLHPAIRLRLCEQFSLAPIRRTASSAFTKSSASMSRGRRN